MDIAYSPESRAERLIATGRVVLAAFSLVAVTRDVSASGIFFEADRSFTAGGRIRLSLVLPHASPGGPLRLECEAEIVRVEERGRRVGVAAQLTDLTVEPAEPARAAGAGPASDGDGLVKGESSW
jgi:hypothetical protein